MVRTREIAPPEAARNMIFAYIKPKLERAGVHPTFSVDEVRVVWFAYILGNWKALVTTTLPEQLYYEITYRDSTKEVYIDTYNKVSNEAFAVEAVPLYSQDLHGV